MATVSESTHAITNESRHRQMTTVQSTGISGRGAPSPTRERSPRRSRSMLSIPRLGSFRADGAPVIEGGELVVGAVGCPHHNDASAFLHKWSNGRIHACGFLLLGEFVLHDHAGDFATDLVRTAGQRLDHGAVGVRDAAFLEFGPLKTQPMGKMVLNELATARHSAV